MAKYQVKDNQSGKTVTVEGDHPPTQQDAEEIFQKAGLRDTSTPNSPREGAVSSTIGGIPGLGGVTRALGSGILSGADLVGQGAAEGGQALAEATGLSKGGNPNPQIAGSDWQDLLNQREAAGAEGFIGHNDVSQQIARKGVVQAAKTGANIGAFGVPLGAAGKMATGNPLVGAAVSKLPGSLPLAADLATSGATAGGLNAFSQPNSDLKSTLAGAGMGAILNPAMYGAGKLVTDAIPKYLGFRAYGKAGMSLPDVTKAENAAGDLTLKEIRDNIINSSTKTVNKDEIYQLMNDTANQGQWVGTPGIENSALPALKRAYTNSDSFFDFYDRVKNMAYATPPNQWDKTDQFLASMAGIIRNKLIDSTDNPEATRQAMDLYAAKVAMDKGSAISKGPLQNQLNSILSSNATQSGEAGLAGLLALIPGAHGLSLPLLADAALTNKVVGPKIAKGLVNVGENGAMKGLGSALQRLGVMKGSSLFGH